MLGRLSAQLYPTTNPLERFRKAWPSKQTGILRFVSTRSWSHTLVLCTVLCTFASFSCFVGMATSQATCSTVTVTSLRTKACALKWHEQSTKQGSAPFLHSPQNCRADRPVFSAEVMRPAMYQIHNVLLCRHAISSSGAVAWWTFIVSRRWRRAQAIQILIAANGLS